MSDERFWVGLTMGAHPAPRVLFTPASYELDETGTPTLHASMSIDPHVRADLARMLRAYARHPEGGLPDDPIPPAAWLTFEGFADRPRGYVHMAFDMLDDLVLADESVDMMEDGRRMTRGAALLLAEALDATHPTEHVEPESD